MEHVALVLVPIIVVPVVMAVPVIMVALFIRAARHKRELLSRERLAAIEKGLEVPLMDMPDMQRRKDPSLAALIVTGTGIGLAIFFHSVAGGNEQGGDPWGIGVLVAMIGLAMLVHWFIRGRKEYERD